MSPSSVISSLVFIDIQNLFFPRYLVFHISSSIVVSSFLRIVTHKPIQTKTKPKQTQPQKENKLDNSYPPRPIRRIIHIFTTPTMITRQSLNPTIHQALPRLNLIHSHSTHFMPLLPLHLHRRRATLRTPRSHNRSSRINTHTGAINPLNQTRNRR